MTTHCRHIVLNHETIRKLISVDCSPSLDTDTLWICSFFSRNNRIRFELDAIMRILQYRGFCHVRTPRLLDPSMSSRERGLVDEYIIK